MWLKEIQQTYIVQIFKTLVFIKENSCHRTGEKKKFFHSLNNMNQNTRLNEHFSGSREVSRHISQELKLVTHSFSFFINDLKKPLYCEICKPAANSTLPSGQKPSHWPEMPKSLDSLCKWVKRWQMT